MTFSDSPRIAHQLGYRVDAAGNVFNPQGKPMRPSQNDGGYLRFRVGKTRTCSVHRLQAYQLFGEAIFQPGIEVRHLDGNRQNNSAENFAMGNKVENAADKIPETRMRCAVHASRAAQRHDHGRILELHRAGLSYNAIMREMGITSKGTVSFAVRKSMAAAA